MRLFDFIISSIAIIILLPFMLPLMLALKFTGEHDIFYKQTRIGKNEKPFYILKFATMIRNSPDLPGGLITAPNDPRLLPLGKFLRKTKINELPQLINIFIGQMSIVGYRPFAEKHYDLYSEEIRQHISTIKPGLTGIGSIVFRNEEEILHSVSNKNFFHDEIITPFKGQLECWYVKNRSIKNYFLIIICTIFIIIDSKNNIWKNIFDNLPTFPGELKDYI